MIRSFRRFLRSTDGAAAVEAAIFAPFYLVLTVGVTDLGSGMFVGTQVNAAAQAGAAYASIHYPNSGACASMTTACLSGIQTAMNDATGNSLFCTTATCTAQFTSCAEANGGICFVVTANYSSYSPILPDAVYAWATGGYSSTATVRVQ